MDEQFPQESHPRTPAEYHGYTHVRGTTRPCPLKSYHQIQAVAAQVTCHSTDPRRHQTWLHLGVYKNKLEMNAQLHIPLLVTWNFWLTKKTSEKKKTSENHPWRKRSHRTNHPQKRVSFVGCCSLVVVLFSWIMWSCHVSGHLCGPWKLRVFFSRRKPAFIQASKITEKISLSKCVCFPFFVWEPRNPNTSWGGNLGRSESYPKTSPNTPRGNFLGQSKAPKSGETPWEWNKKSQSPGSASRPNFAHWE